MDYTDLVKEIRDQGITKLPALLIVVANQCVEKKVFAPGGMERVIAKIIASQPNKSTGRKKPCDYDHTLLRERGARYCENCLKDLRR